MHHHTTLQHDMAVIRMPTPLPVLQVCAVTRGGAFAEEVVVPEGAVLKLPQGLDLTTAAGWCF